MRVSQAVIADRHAETTGDVMGDAHAPAAKGCPIAWYPILFGAKI